MSNSFTKKTGFTLIEILVAMGLLAILAGVTVAAINPARQFAQGRNTQRQADLSAILSSITQNMVEHRGKFDCANTIPNNLSIIKQTNGVDLRHCLVPAYLPELPVDPSVGRAYSQDTYDTGYEIMQDGPSGRISLKAPSAELGLTVEVIR